MLRRALAVFDRFAAARLDARRAGVPIRDGQGRPLGRVEEVRLSGRRLVVRGEARGEAITASRGPDSAGARLEPGREAPFEVALPLPDGPAPLVLRLSEGGREVELRLAVPSLARARAALWPAFGLAALRAAPDAWRWSRTGDPAFRARIRKALALDLAPEGLPVDAGMLAPPAGPAPMGPVTILLPVFNAIDDLRDCLARVEAHTDVPWRLVLVEDASPDPRVRPWLRGWAAARAPQVDLLENAENLGFVGSVNRGLEHARAVAPDVPLVLLNSDAMVPAGWASRLLGPLLADPSVASVTPMSNDSEVTSVPVLCARSDLRPGEADRIDGEARRLDPLRAVAPLPTGVGFCMALSPRFIDLVPGLDPAFGRGYGEEVDWCRRTRALGGRHVGSAALFVEHRGGGSFGSEQKRALIARNGRIISQRYPSFDEEVRTFIAQDPLATPRLALALAWAAARAEALAGEDRLLPVILAHAIGGGADLAVLRRVREGLARGLPAVLVRVGLQARWRIEVHGPDGGVTAAQTDDEAALRRLLQPLRRRRVVYACGVGDPDPVEIPALLLSLAGEAEEAALEVELHDYFPVSPSYTLLGAQGRFEGPVVAGASSDPAHAARRPDGSRVDLAAWQAAWRPLLARARVTAFSRASLDLLLAAYPEAAPQARVVPHAALATVAPVARPSGPRVLGVLGNIAPHKGAALVQGIARLLPSNGIARLVLIGDVDPAFALPRSVRVHGPYEPGDIAGLAQRYRVTDWLIPSVWPETFSFTTREALATGLPTYAFALGAQGEAVEEAPNGRPLPRALSSDPRATLAALAAQGNAQS